MSHDEADLQDAVGTTDSREENDGGGYIKTMTHNFVSRKAHIDGAKQVEIKGRSILHDSVHVKGDLAIVRIGRYCEIESDTLLEPPSHPLDPSTRIPLIIGSHTHIGTACQIKAAAVGSMVWIGNGVTLGPRVIVKDNCIIEDGVQLGADTVVPPFTRISAQNPILHTELPPSMSAHMHEISLDRYQDFKMEQRESQ
jgi:dynactin 5